MSCHIKRDSDFWPSRGGRGRGNLPLGLGRGGRGGGGRGGGGRGMGGGRGSYDRNYSYSECPPGNCTPWRPPLSPRLSVEASLNAELRHNSVEQSGEWAMAIEGQ